MLILLCIVIGEGSDIGFHTENTLRWRKSFGLNSKMDDIASEFLKHKSTLHRRALKIALNWDLQSKSWIAESGVLPKN